MGQAHSHQRLELRLKVLGDRIRTLKDKMSHTEGLQKIEALGLIERLESRYKELEDRLGRAEPGGPRFPARHEKRA